MTLKKSFIYLIAFALALGSFYSCETMGSKGTGGLALYTVRAEMKQSADSTLQQVADAGYAYIEAAGYEDGKYYGYSPEGFKNLLEEKGLIPISTHQSSVTLDNADQLIADAKAAGFTYFVVPIPPMGMFVYDREAMSMGMNGSVERLAEILTELGQKCRDAGLQLLYHNHDFEFKADEQGVVPIEYLLENTDPELVNFQMDLFWVNSAGADPLAYFEKYPGRFKLWHVKDMDEKGRFAPVGKGTIDFARILEHKENSGMKYYFVEQDMTFDQTPLEAIRISHEGIEAVGFK